MTYTWGEIQILAIQKMFLNNDDITTDDLTDMRADRKYKLYLNAMPAVANEGLLRLMSVGKPLIKKHTLTYNLPDEIYDYQSYETLNVINDDLEIEGNASKAYYFEINNDATIEVYKNISDTWTKIDTITHVSTVAGSYETYKALIDNTSDEEIKLVFKASGYIYSIRNVALYSSNFRYEEEIYDNTKKQKYDLQTLIKDFYEIVSVEYEKDETIGQYNSDFTLEGDNTLIIDSSLKGNFIITYKAYPTKITSTTSDAYKFTIPSEMISLLPLYIASELYKDDDISLATTWRNQFEVSLSEVKIIEEPMEFANNSNWL